MSESIESSAKEFGMGIARISISASSTLAKELRNFLIALRYSMINNGENYYKDFLKSTEGHKFRDESSFINVTYDKKNSDIEKACVSKTDKAILEKMTHKLGIDYYLARRPSNLEELAKRYLDGENLSSYDKKTVEAFTFRDEKGELLLDPDDPSMPLLSDGEYILCFATKDLNKWEIVCSQLEAKQKTFHEKVSDSKILSYLMNKANEIGALSRGERGPEK